MAAHNHSRRTKIKKLIITLTDRKRLLWVSMGEMRLLDANHEAISTLYYKFKWQILTRPVSIFQTAHTQKRPDALTQWRLSRLLAAFKLQNEREIITSQYQQEVLQCKIHEYNRVQGRILIRIKAPKCRGNTN